MTATATKRKQVTFDLLEHQSDFVASKSRFIMNSGGVGSGKTYSNILKALKLSILYPGIFGLITAQTFPVLRDTIMRDFFDVVPSEFISYHNKNENSIKFTNGSGLIYRSFDDPSKAKSLTLGYAAIEEATDIDFELFKMLRTRMRQKGMPGQIFGSTNADSLGNWVYKNFIETPIKGSEVFYSSSMLNTFLPKEYLADLEELKKTNPEYYNRMVLGQWGQLEGLIYNLPMGQRIKPAIIPKEGRHIAGLDFGYTNPTSLTCLRENGEKWFLFDETYRFKMTTSEIIALCREKHAKFDFDKIYCDGSRPEIIEEMRREGLPTEGAIKDVFAGIMHFKGLIGEKRFYCSSDCTKALREFDSYVWDSRQAAGPKEQPLKINDHAMDGLRYALYTDYKRPAMQIIENVVMF